MAHHSAGPLCFRNDGTLIDRKKGLKQRQRIRKIDPEWLHEIEYDSFRLRALSAMATACF